MYSEEFYRAALNHIEGFSHATLKKMLLLSGNATRLFTEPDVWRSKIGNKKQQEISNPTISSSIKRRVDEELRQLEKKDIRSCLITDNTYPSRLKNCADGPISFYYIGNNNFNVPHQVAIVGTRNATEYGRSCVRKLLLELRDSSITTISGLAYGIDTEAHERSLENGIRTIAVMGCGFNAIYPKQNEALSQKIVHCGGTLISEYTFYTLPDKMNFPRRNRIIAGMADATIVMESGEKGGSIITAHIAHSYNRDVFAIPGSILEGNYDGCHTLIAKNIAAILTSGKQLMEYMNWASESHPVQTNLFIELSEDEQCIFDLIQAARSLSIDAIIEANPHKTPSQIAGLLLGLELKGVLTCLPGKRYSTCV